MEKLLTPSMADLVLLLLLLLLLLVLVLLLGGAGAAGGGLGVCSRGSEEEDDIRNLFSGWK